MATIISDYIVPVVRRHYTVRWRVKNNGTFTNVTVCDPHHSCPNWHSPRDFVKWVFGCAWHGGGPYPLRDQHLAILGNPGENGVWQGTAEGYEFEIRDSELYNGQI